MTPAAPVRIDPGGAPANANENVQVPYPAEQLSSSTREWIPGSNPSRRRGPQWAVSQKLDSAKRLVGQLEHVAEGFLARFTGIHGGHDLVRLIDDCGVCQIFPSVLLRGCSLTPEQRWWRRWRALTVGY